MIVKIPMGSNYTSIYIDIILKVEEKFVLRVNPIVERALKPLNLVERGTIVKVRG